VESGYEGIPKLHAIAYPTLMSDSSFQIPQTNAVDMPSAPVEETATQTSAVADWVVTPTSGEVITSEATGNTYTMGEKIGEGNFGVVYSCVDVWNNNLAVKVLKPLGPYEKVKAAAEAELGKLLFLRHPHITYVFDAFEYRATFYIVTERCYTKHAGALNHLRRRYCTRSTRLRLFMSRSG
jgi:serine/threonine protein kinase